jgi:hypothetical protein
VDEQYRAPLVPLTTDLGVAFCTLATAPILAVRASTLSDCPRSTPTRFKKWMGSRNISALMEIGQSAGKEVKMAHFGPFVQST